MQNIEKKITSSWNFDNTYADLPKVFFSVTNPTPVKSPRLVILNEDLARSIGVNPNILKTDDGFAMLSGNKVCEGSYPIAQAYAGHQFGYFTMLGDGRAILLGEHIKPNGERVDIQLKGSGITPYSRGGDGRAALGPMLREYIISEAMYALGVPTTRSLAVVETGEDVIRETILPGAILTRVASSHLRVGTFQYAAKFCSLNELKTLADYAVNRHFPYLINDENKYISLLREVVKNQAKTIAKWQLIGFIHGVMNTDNMTISGETIDYGPCAFMDIYNPQTVFSSIDKQGRYAYGNQPDIAMWDLARFAETLLPLFNENMDDAIKLAENEVMGFKDIYYQNWLKGMRYKLGLYNEELEDDVLIENLLDIMIEYNLDYTNTFLALTFDKLDDLTAFKTEKFKTWYDLWKERLNRQDNTKESCYELMKNSNPSIIPRNHRVEEALDAAVLQGDYSVMNNLLHALSNPYAHTKEQIKYSTLPPQSTKTYKTYCGT